MEKTLVKEYTRVTVSPSELKEDLAKLEVLREKRVATHANTSDVDKQITVLTLALVALQA